MGLSHSLLGWSPIPRDLQYLVLPSSGYLAWHSSRVNIFAEAYLGENIQTQFRRGALELCVLAVLARGDEYGYEITSRLTRDMEVNEGTVYPLLRRMQKEGLVSTYSVKSASGPSRKYYRLTASGRSALRMHRSEWEAFQKAMTNILGSKE
jgi:PadR family transcriptional regulator PadR